MITDDNTTIENNPRSINELLQLKTYQGMTDDEIDVLINYKVEIETSSRIAERNRTLAGQIAARVVLDNANSCEKAHEALQSILGLKPTLTAIELVLPDEPEVTDNE